MTKSFFSPLIERTSKNLANKIQVLLAEQRHQRADLSEIKFMLHKLLTNKDLQDTTNKYYSDRVADPDYIAPPEVADLD